jgi:predicted nucleic acid-binding protein
VQSFDTNVLLYAINRDCAEHEPCRALIAKALDTPSDWVVADQLWFELYRLLRHPNVLQRPLDAATADVLCAFQRRYRPWRIDGRLDGETHARARALRELINC